MSLGLFIAGIIVAVIGYLLERFTTGILSTLGKIALWVGVIVAIIGLILWLIGLAGVALLTTVFA